MDKTKIFLLGKELIQCKVLMKKLKEYMNRSTGCQDILEILSETEFNIKPTEENILK